MSTRLDIISDPVCPWCYLGAANLLRALTARGSHPFAIRWLPFQLNPDMPPGGIDRQRYMQEKFGGGARVDAMHARLEAMGAEAGITFRFERIARSPNTLDAHRLIHWAAAEGVQTRVAMALFRRYFEAGEDISDAGVLRGAAEEAGMDGGAIARLLAGDVDHVEVRAAADEARDRGVTGVPTFVIGGRHAVSGAQPVTLWTRLMDDLEVAAARPA
jgi:predicted DsbA family dithiol-disulfide isomerase